ncbi:MAG: hypothetical protein GY821_13010 [Gammaproteobacteria bacterium]|nr:hypothetical protein [Gammaproteobacteria bacterium]MCP4475459.1 hypothetical protein [Gammaproteobacteria bacterium]
MSFQHKITVFLSTIVIALQLSGCTPEQNQLHLIKHPRVLKKILLRCEKMESSRQHQDPICAQAFYTAQQLQKLLTALMTNREKFGQQIIDDQIELAALKTSVAQTKPGAKRDALVTKMDSLQNRIEVMQAVTVLAGG